jgi:hypothetical protein
MEIKNVEIERTDETTVKVRYTDEIDALISQKYFVYPARTQVFVESDGDARELFEPVPGAGSNLQTPVHVGRPGDGDELERIVRAMFAAADDGHAAGEPKRMDAGDWIAATGDFREMMDGAGMEGTAATTDAEIEEAIETLELQYVEDMLAVYSAPVDTTDDMDDVRRELRATLRAARDDMAEAESA